MVRLQQSENLVSFGLAVSPAFDETVKEPTRHFTQLVESHLQDFVLSFRVVAWAVLFPMADPADLRPFKQRMPGDFFNLRSVDDDFGFRNSHRKSQADVSPGDRVAILTVSDQPLAAHATINDLRGVKWMSR